jgi:alkylation response protein AidB-like acyl-CoA dehydrogenase
MPDKRIKEYNEIVSECRRFARNEIRPEALERDLTLATDWVLGLWRKSHELDIPWLLLPENINGAGYPELCGAYVLDAIAMECAGVASIFAHHFSACIPLSHINGAHTENKKILWDAKNSRIPLIGTVIFPNDLDDQTISIQRDNEDFIINGKSSLTANADLAHIYFVFIAEDTSGENITCAMIDKRTSGIGFSEKAELSGLKTNSFKEVIFEEIKIGSDAIIATGEHGKALFDKCSNSYYGFVAAMAMGTARTAYAKALAYAKERYQFGQIIIHHDEIQRMLGSMKMKIDMGTAGYVQAFETDRINLPALSADARLAKAYCTQAALEIVQDAIQIHGGYGYMHEYGLEKIMRDVKILQLLGGRNPYHHIQAITEEL